jgi:HK97 gp10 family phage protein
VSSISVNIKGHEELERKYKQIAIRLGQVNKDSLSDVAKLLKTDVIKSIKKKSYGGTDVRYNPQRTVTVSAKGKAPNHDLGGLVRGIRSRVVRGKKGVYNVEFKSTAPYALDLEFGTKKMRARPYMRPTLKRNRKKIKAMLAQGVRRAL